jgi:putrescine aminotransferase
MNMITNHLPTAELQKLDAAHHMHPFTAAMGAGQAKARGS